MYSEVVWLFTFCIGTYSIAVEEGQSLHIYCVVVVLVVMLCGVKTKWAVQVLKYIQAR